MPVLRPPGTYWFLQVKDRDVLGFSGCPAHRERGRPRRRRLANSFPSPTAARRPPLGLSRTDTEDFSFLAGFRVHDSSHWGELIFLSAS